MGNLLHSVGPGESPVVLDNVMRSFALPSPDYFNGLTPPRRDNTRGPHVPVFDGQGNMVPGQFRISGVVEVFSDQDVGLVQGDEGEHGPVGVYYGQDPNDGPDKVPLNSLGAWQFEGATKHELLKPLVGYLKDKDVMDGPNGLLAHMYQVGDQVFDEILAEASDRGEGVVDYAKLARIPMAVACKMAGIPEEDMDKVAGWVAETQKDPVWDKPQILEEEAYYGDLLAYYKRRARLHPGEDPTNIMEVLVRAQGDPDYRITHPHTGLQEPINDRLLIAQDRMMGVAALDTSRNLAGNVTQELTEHNMVGAILQDPRLLRPSVREAIRRAPTFPRSLGIVRRPVVIGEGDGRIEVQPFEVLEGIITAANFDPRKFPDPYAFKLGRPGRDRTFGGGWRGCIGEALGRQVVTYVAGQVIRRLVDVQTDPDVPVVRNDGLVNSIQQYRLRFDLQRSLALQAARS